MLLGVAGHIGLIVVGQPVEQPVIDSINFSELKWAACRADLSLEANNTPVDAAEPGKGTCQSDL